jgi:hypothetical protein
MRAGTAIAAAIAALVLVAPHAPATASAVHPRVPAWERALMLRGRALDRADGLGSFRPLGRGLHLSGTDRRTPWLRAIELRSIGLDRVHHLGSFASAPIM